MDISTRDAHSLSAAANRAGAVVLGGQLQQEGTRFIINKANLNDLLASLVGQTVMVIVTGVKEEASPQLKTCLTCGRDYTEAECPHCSRVRSRLRGHS